MFKKFGRIVYPIFFGMVVLAFGLLSKFAGQSMYTIWDLCNHHFYNGYGLLHHRLNFDVAPAQVQTYFLSLLDIPVYLTVKYFPPDMAGFFWGAIQGINFFLLFILSREITRYFFQDKKNIFLVSFFSASLGLYAPGFLWEFGGTSHDNVVSIFFLLAVYIFVKAVGRRGSGEKPAGVFWTLFSGGFFLGAGCGLKPTLIIYWLSFALAYMFCGLWSKNKLKSSFYFLAGSLAGFIPAGGYGLYLLNKYFYSPIFPFFNKYFKSPFLSQENVRMNMFKMAKPANIFDWLSWPYNYLAHFKTIFDFHSRDFRFGLAGGLFLAYLIKILFFSKRTAESSQKDQISEMKIIRRFLLILFLAAYLLWKYFLVYYRYIIPIELLVPIIIFLLTALIFEKRRVLFFILFSLLVLLAFTPPLQGRKVFQSSYFGLPDPAEFRQFDDSVIIMATWEPLTYVVPYFPGNTRFVRLLGNLPINDRYELLITQILRKYKKIYFLNESKVDNKFLAPLFLKYRLAIDPVPVFKFNSRFHVFGIYKMSSVFSH